MQKQNPIDDLFRSGLAGYRVTPSDEHREEFIREASGIGAKRSWTGWWLIAGTILILAGSIAFLLTNRRDGHPSSPVSGTIPAGKEKMSVSALPATPETGIKKSNANLNKPITNLNKPAINLNQPTISSKEPITGSKESPAGSNEPANALLQPAQKSGLIAQNPSPTAPTAAPSGVIAQNEPSRDQLITNKETKTELKTGDKTPPAENPALDQKTSKPGSNPPVIRRNRAGNKFSQIRNPAPDKTREHRKRSGL